MREIRMSGSEGGAAQTNASFLPLSSVRATLRVASALSPRFTPE